jgi:hypothetical protein
MTEDALHAALARWGDFYLITGTAAAALTGLQFVVQTLLATDLRNAIGSADPESGINAFGSPTVVHFTLALVLACAMTLPWPGYGALQFVLAALGAGALTYAFVVLRRTVRQRAYRPVAEDWIWHLLLPAAAYAGVLVAGVSLPSGAEASAGQFIAVGGASLLLLCIGIHNAWDTVAYLTVSSIRRDSAGERPLAGAADQADDAP